MASGGSSALKVVFDKYSRFGKTEAQLKEKEPRLESKNVQKMMKDAGVIDSKYTTQLLDNDIARVLGKLSTAGTYARGM
jgi:tRNA A37 N6-isopentenylltransferase MiaA